MKIRRLYGAKITPNGIECDCCGADLMPEDAVVRISHSSTQTVQTDTFSCVACGNLITRQTSKLWAAGRGESRRIGGIS